MSSAQPEECYVAGDVMGWHGKRSQPVSRAAVMRSRPLLDLLDDA